MGRFNASSIDMGDEIKTVNASVMKQFLQQAIQSINKK